VRRISEDKEKEYEEGIWRTEKKYKEEDGSRRITD
jgi:hypothetical protein